MSDVVRIDDAHAIQCDVCEGSGRRPEGYSCCGGQGCRHCSGPCDECEGSGQVDGPTGPECKCSECWPRYWVMFDVHDEGESSDSLLSAVVRATELAVLHRAEAIVLLRGEILFRHAGDGLKTMRGKFESDLAADSITG